MQRFGCYRETSGHCADTVIRSFVTHTVGWLLDFGATQHIERATIPSVARDYRIRTEKDFTQHFI
jgi:hypothetical protein